MKPGACGVILLAFFAGAVNAAAQDTDVIFYGPAAQGAPSGGIVAGSAGEVRIATAPGVPLGMPIDVLSVEPFDIGKPVVGAPYSAEITTEIVQQLADGNRIERRSTSSVARDAQGRVRREQQLAAIGPILPAGRTQVVTISDPVANVHYTLDAERKVAIQLPTPGFVQKFDAAGGPTFNVQIQKDVLFTRSAVDPNQSQDARTETLGTREIEGVTAEGTRVTVAIPAGAIGNQAPIEIVSERWYSPDLQTVVYSRRSDPRFGDTTYRLTGIVRAEPPAELFAVPPDYTIEQASGPAFGIRKFAPPTGQ